MHAYVGYAHAYALGAMSALSHVVYIWFRFYKRSERK